MLLVLVEGNVWDEFRPAVESIGEKWTAPSGRVYHLSLQGKRWNRPKDTVGLAGVVNGLGGPHRDYLAAGGLGFILGDGRLNYGPEMILETYYNWQMRKGVNLMLDLQGIDNPGYNRDRGPLFVVAVRAHFEY